MNKTTKRSDQRQMNMLLPIEGKSVTKTAATTVAYRSKEFYDIREKLVKSLPSKK
ncbi:hypothetical protein [Hyphomonas sp.]|uniref:hypothetical protein n=1 Tax=Hyphomonas sp. TaxID=87 RepID=UPI0025BE4F90|nr:hypothetical protein [Hyphomonas sp.]